MLTLAKLLWRRNNIFENKTVFRWNPGNVIMLLLCIWKKLCDRKCHFLFISLVHGVESVKITVPDGSTFRSLWKIVQTVMILTCYQWIWKMLTQFLGNFMETENKGGWWHCQVRLNSDGNRPSGERRNQSRNFRAQKWQQRRNSLRFKNEAGGMSPEHETLCPSNHRQVLHFVKLKYQHWACAEVSLLNQAAGCWNEEKIGISPDGFSSNSDTFSHHRTVYESRLVSFKNLIITAYQSLESPS